MSEVSDGSVRGHEIIDRMSTKLEVIPRDLTVNGRRSTVESDTTLIPARSLDALAETVRHEHDLVVKAGQRMLEHAVLCGDALREAKARKPKGGWLRWLAENFPASDNTAAFYMRSSFYVDLLRDHNIETCAAAREFLRDHDLTMPEFRPITDEQRDQMRALAEGGMSFRAIARLVGASPHTVARTCRDLQAGKRDRDFNKGKIYKRKAGRKAKRLVFAITDDLIEGAAIKLREVFGNGGNVTDSDRETAVEILRAAFTYDGPIPGAS